MQQITAIKRTKNDNGKCILISFRGILNMPKSKPAYSVDSFADFYPDTNCLTTYYYNKGKPYYFNNFKEALQFLRKL